MLSFCPIPGLTDLRFVSGVQNGSDVRPANSTHLHKIPAYHPKGYANELAICQRYYYQVSGLGARVAMGLFNNSTLFLFPFFVPVSMRVSPTIVSQNTGVYRMGANIIPGKNITILRRMPNNGYILQMTINTPLPSPLGETETGLLSSSTNSTTLLLSFVADL